MRTMLVIVLLLTACDPPARAPKPYEVVLLQPFSEEEAERTCPTGYTLLHREYCRDNTQLVSATIVCN